MDLQVAVEKCWSRASLSPWISETNLCCCLMLSCCRRASPSSWVSETNLCCCLILTWRKQACLSLEPLLPIYDAHCTSLYPPISEVWCSLETCLLLQTFSSLASADSVLSWLSPSSSFSIHMQTSICNYIKCWECQCQKWDKPAKTVYNNC